MTLDEAIKENKEDLKIFIGYYEQKLNNKDFKYIYRKFKNFYSAAAFTSAFTALLLKNNINPLNYMDHVPVCFAYDLSIESFEIPNNITYIWGNAFDGCKNLKSIHIPNSVKEIYTAAFYACNNLSDIYYKGSKEDWENIKINNYMAYNNPLLNANIHYNS